ncbi:MAG: peptide chain release factor N(5)-glutamine methyltransferase [Ilumatobacteraceae bacterium]
MSDDGTITWQALWLETTALLGDRVVARWLCEEASGAEGGEFLDQLGAPATQRMVAHLDAMVGRVRAGEPVQYVLGHWSFRRLDLLVDRRVLIPRPETELLVEHAMRLLAGRPRPLVLADLGTGSGAIGLSFAMELRHDDLEVWISDASPDALDVARANLAGIGRAATNVRVAHGSWFEALPADRRGSFDLIASNPPYVRADADALEPIVRDWEPAAALFSGGDGLDDVRQIGAGAPEWLSPGGWLIMEIGAEQGAPAQQVLREAGLGDVTVLADLAGLHRFVVGRRP